MENDYLWDKTGEDAEIEELEKTLQVFRYQETDAPLIPVKIVETKPKFSLFSLKFAFSFAACIAVLLGGFFAWSRLSPQQNFAETIANRKSVERPQIVIKQPNVIVTETRPKQEFTAEPINISYRQKEISAPVIRKIGTKKANLKIQLTDEEQYAYNQLMLALSITGSKLKEVQDKANGKEETVSTVKSFK